MIYRNKEKLLDAEFKGINREVAEKMITNFDGKYINLFTRDEMIDFVIQELKEKDK